MRRTDFTYPLPPELIATHPARPRSSARLLVLGADRPVDMRIADFPGLLRPGDLLIANDTRVIPARLFGTKDSGGRVEVLIERVLGPDLVLAQVRASKTPRPGGRIHVQGCDGVFAMLGRDGDFFKLRLVRGESVAQVLEQAGHVPLPPYIERPADSADREHYQTVFASAPGAVAAPTAGLHFDAELLAAIAARGAQVRTLTLHVGAGTFQPVRVEDLAEHRMHAERYMLPAELAAAITDTRACGGRVIAIGTTVVRALESAVDSAGALQSGAGETRLFITPGYRFRCVNALLTNFHLPESTLLMLVCAFAGQRRVLDAYAHAVTAGYRFFSYGDAMLLTAQAS